MSNSITQITQKKKAQIALIKNTDYTDKDTRAVSHHRFISLSLYLLVSLSFFLACAQKENSIVILYDLLPQSLDPHLKKTLLIVSILSNIYEPLIDFDANMKIIPALAEYWEKVDSLTWRFTLRKGVKFHNGKEFDAQDVLFSLYRPFSLPKSEYKTHQAYLDTAMIEDEDKIILKTKVPYTFVLYDLATIFILPEGFNSEKDIPTGTGPYCYVNMTNEELALKYFDQYWGEKPAIKRIYYRLVLDYKKRIEALAKKSADIITHIPFSELEQLKKVGNIIVTPGVSTRYIEFNLNKFPFNQKSFRDAVNLAIDRARITWEVYKGYATPANQYLPPGVFGFDHSLEPIPYIPDSARKLFKNLGKLPVIKFDYATPRAVIAEAIVNELIKVGIKIEGNPLTTEDFWEKIGKGFSDFYLIAYVPNSYEGYGALLSLFHTYQPEMGLGMMNRIGYSNNNFDKIIEKLPSVFDQRIVVEKMLEAQQILLSDLPKIPFVWEKEIYGVSERIEWLPRLDGEILLKEIKFKE